MKLLRLDLMAVGPFTGQSLDLSGGDHGLHVVVGPNEAGKSSALRSVAALLFGFATRTAWEDAVHKSTDVRVGGLLRHSDGSELAVVRRRGAAKTLLAGDGKTPLPDDALAKFLGTVDRTTFDTFFGLGHATLRDGAAALLDAGGQVGRALFSAGPGGKPLRVALDRYVEQAEGVYKPSGKNQELPKALADYQVAKKAVGDVSLPPDTWMAERRAHDEATAAAEAVRDQLRALHDERARLERIRRAIPLLAERAVTAADLDRVADAPRLPADFAARRSAAERDVAAAGRAAADARRALSAVSAELDAVVVPDELLARAEAIDGLYARLAGYQKAAAAVPTARAALAAAIGAVGRLVDDLRPGEPVAADADAVLLAADPLRLSTARRARLTALSEEFVRVTERQAAAARDVSQAAAARRRLAADVADLPPAVDVSAARAAVDAATAAGDLDRQLAVARAEQARATTAADAARRALPLVPAAADAVTLPVPSAESVDLAAADRAAADAEHRRAADAVAAVARRSAALDAQLSALRLAGPVPNEAALTAARRERDELWATVRDSPAAAREPYEAAVRTADAIADALRRESARVADQARLTSEKSALAVERADADRTAAVAVEAGAAAERRWRSLWAASGIEPLSPVEMRPWLTRQAEVVRRATDVAGTAAATAAVAEQLAAHRSSIAAALGEAAGEGPLASLLERGRAVVEQARAAAERRRRAEDKLRETTADAGPLALAAEAADAAVGRWRADWAAAVAGLGLPAGAEPGEAGRVVDRCNELAEAVDAARAVAARLSVAESEAEQFAVDVAALTSAAGLPDQAVADLRRAVDAGRREATRRDELRRRRTSAERAVEAAALAESAAADDLAAVCRLAGCAADGLPEAERRAAERQSLEAAIKQADREVRLLAGGEAVDGLVAAAEATTPEAVALRLTDLESTASTLDAVRAGHHRRVGEATHKLAGWTGVATAAEQADAAQMVLARARAAASKYVRLRLAAGVLRQGIERHRQRKQGPMVARAGGLFGSLTLGSFARLDVVFADGDEPVLVGVRPDGRAVRVGQMSDGTRDQLYLALRLAAVEDFAGRNEPVPLLVDDVLVHFDDGRSRAALAALGELSRRTQVVLFTHHDRVADLAEAAAGGAAVVHRFGD